jgi:hypothetical protein
MGVALVILIILAVILAAGLWGTLRFQRAGLTRLTHDATIDPFAVSDPWRRLVQRALRAQGRYRHVVDAAEPGPTRDHLVEIGAGVDDAVSECWRIARRGNELSKALASIDVAASRSQIAALRDQPAAADRLASLQAQVDSYSSISATASRTETELRTLVERLDEAAARGAQLAVASGEGTALDTLRTDVSDVVDELDALRMALEEIGRPGLPPG